MTNPIGWCDRTWNPVTGCSWASSACDHCYAKSFATRLAGRFGYPTDEPFRVTFHPDKLGEPLRWRKPQRVFVCSMGDLFHEDVQPEWLAQVWEIMAAASWHTFLVLTKRPEMAKEVFDAWKCGGWRGLDAKRTPLGNQWPLSNIWLGVTVENQEQADKRIPILLDTPAAKRFVSCEPLLGPIELSGTYYDYLLGWDTVPAHDPSCDGSCRSCPIPVQIQTECLDWVIAGPENGRDKRPMDLAWPRQLRDDCSARGVPFYYKGGLLDGVAHREFPS